MKRRVVYCLVLVALGCAAAPFAPGQDDVKPATKPKEKEKYAYVYRTFIKLTELSGEYEREDWCLTSSYFDSSNSNTLTGIFRRKYTVRKPDSEPLKGLQQKTWKAAQLLEYGRERDLKSYSLTLAFKDNGFTFTQADPSKPSKPPQYTQAGTVQYAQHVSGAFYAVDLLVEAETRDGLATPPPYTTIRALISYDDKQLFLASNGSLGDRPSPAELSDGVRSNNEPLAVYSRYERDKTSGP
jgi:hypothetical protein